MGTRPLYNAGFPPGQPPTLALVQARIASKSVRDPATGCRNWIGAMSRSGFRRVRYPHLRVGPQLFRVNRLVLLLQIVAAVPGMPFAEALAGAEALCQGDEAAHTCDNSHCVEGAHLAWKSHQANIAEQMARRASRAGEAGEAVA